MAVYPYIRVQSSTPSGDEQAKLLATVTPNAPVLDSRPPEGRDRLIEKLVAGDMVVVCAPYLLGADTADAKECLERILKAGAWVRSMEPAITLSPDHALATLQFLSEITMVMRRTRRRVAKKPGPKGMSENALPQAQRDWFDLSLTRHQVAERHGVSWRTLYRQFGPREG